MKMDPVNPNISLSARRHLRTSSVDKAIDIELSKETPLQIAKIAATAEKVYGLYISAIKKEGADAKRK